MKRILVTGAAGFIGFHTCKRLVELGFSVTGLDNFNSYYSTELKRARASLLNQLSHVKIEKIDLCDREHLLGHVAQVQPDYIIHLGAQAGVRHSLDAPQSYIDSNITGTLNVLEACRQTPVQHLVVASSSSVYGMNSKVPFSVEDRTDHPVSLYAATKKSTELLAHAYAHLFKIPTTALRFFTVYGPWGRPDMAYWLFTQAILEGKPIQVFDAKKMKRDFTYIDDIVEGVVRVTQRPQLYRIYNIGNHNPEPLDSFIAAIESATGKKAIRDEKSMQPGDVPITYADVADLEKDIGFAPSTRLQDGIQRFVTWYREYHRV